MANTAAKVFVSMKSLKWGGLPVPALLHTLALKLLGNKRRLLFSLFVSREQMKIFGLGKFFFFFALAQIHFPIVVLYTVMLPLATSCGDFGPGHSIFKPTTHGVLPFCNKSIKEKC